MNNGMQAIKDAGIVVVVILLLVSVRFTQQAETGEELGNASLIPQTEAAPAPPPAQPTRVERSLVARPANAAVVSVSDETPIRQWVVDHGAEIVHSIEIDAATAERCSEVLFHIRKAAEETQNEAIVNGAKEIVKVLPCSA